MKSLLFVGERRSPAAIRMDVRWQDGRLAAKQLFDALSGVGIDPGKCQFLNWWERGSRRRVAEHIRRGGLVVGMGRKVQRELEKKGVAYLGIIHPAARGAIRKKRVYRDHIRSAVRAARAEA